MAGTSAAPALYSRHAWLAAVVPAAARRFRVRDAELASTLADAGAELVDDAPDVEIGPAHELRGDAACAVVSLGRDIAEGDPRLLRAGRRVLGSLELRARARAARTRVRARGYPRVDILLWDIEKRQAIDGGPSSGLAGRFPLDALVVGRRSDGRPTAFAAAAAAAEKTVPGSRLARPHARVSGVLVAASETGILRVALGPARHRLDAQRAALDGLAATAPEPAISDRVPWIRAAGRVGLADWSLEQRLTGSPAPPAPGERLLVECLHFLTSLFSAGGAHAAGPSLVEDTDVVAAACRPGEQDAVRSLGRRTDAALASLPRGFGHGDFWAENLLTSGGGLSGVVDWDGAGPGRLPLLDLLHLQVNADAARTGRHLGPTLIDHELPRARAGGDELIRSYCRALELPASPELLVALLNAYWLRWAASSLRSYADRDRARRPGWVEANVDAVARAFARRGA